MFNWLRRLAQFEGGGYVDKLPDGPRTVLMEGEVFVSIDGVVYIGRPGESITMDDGRVIEL